MKQQRSISKVIHSERTSVHVGIALVTSHDDRDDALPGVQQQQQMHTAFYNSCCNMHVRAYVVFFGNFHQYTTGLCMIARVLAVTQTSCPTCMAGESLQLRIHEHGKDCAYGVPE